MLDIIVTKNEILSFLLSIQILVFFTTEYLEIHKKKKKKKKNAVYCTCDQCDCLNCEHLDQS